MFCNVLFWLVIQTSSHLYPPSPRHFFGDCECSSIYYWLFFLLYLVEMYRIRIFFLLIQSAVKAFMHPKVWVIGLFPEKTYASIATWELPCSFPPQSPFPRIPGEARCPTPFHRWGSETQGHPVAELNSDQVEQTKEINLLPATVCLHVLWGRMTQEHK